MAIVSELTEVKRRVLSLERRLRDLRLVKYLHQLLDVDITYDGVGEVVGGDVLTYDDESMRWIAAAGTGLAPYASISYTGLYDGSAVSDEETEWSLASGGYELAALTGGSLLGTLQEGVDVTEPGIYQVHASVSATMSGGPGTPAVSILHTGATAGWTLDGDVEMCHAPIHATDTGTDAAGVSLLLPLEPDTPVAIDVDMGGCTEVRWRIQVAWVHAAAVETGGCGG